MRSKGEQKEKKIAQNIEHALTFFLVMDLRWSWWRRHDARARSVFAEKTTMTNVRRNLMPIFPIGYRPVTRHGGGRGSRKNMENRKPCSDGVWVNCHLKKNRPSEFAGSEL